MEEAVFRALSHPARREILDILFERDGQTLGELERRFEMTRFGVMKHLRVLEEAGLIATKRVGREKFHYLNPIPIRALHDRWIGKFAAGASKALLGLRSSLEGEGGPMDVEAKPSHVFVVFIRAARERVWEAITSSDFTLRYYYASTVESDWQPGSPYVYRTQGDTAIVGEVIEADPPTPLLASPGRSSRWSRGSPSSP
jgi:DNA-binding transcriptional ArsR family regulator